jgi:hypothetical protein
MDAVFFEMREVGEMNNVCEEEYAFFGLVLWGVGMGRSKTE